MSKIGDEAVVAEAVSTPVEMDENHTLEPTDNTYPAVPTDSESAGAELSPNPNLSQDLAATGKFTRVPKMLFELGANELEETLTQCADDKLDAFARNYNLSEQKQTSYLCRWRCVCGAICAVKHARIRECLKQDIPTIGWQKWNISVGFNRKTSELYEKNWRTVIDAPQMLVEAANREGLDLFQPRIADNLRIILKELAVRTKPQAPRPLLQWLASSFEAGIVRESQEVNRRMLKLPWRIALNPANAELEWQPYQKKAY